MLGVQGMAAFGRLEVQGMAALRRQEVQGMVVLRRPGGAGMAALRRPAQVTAPYTVEIHGELSAHAVLLEESHHKGRQSSSFSFLFYFLCQEMTRGLETGCQE